ncbi:MAG: 2OG-Fe(II) oxygenase [Burkholderiaceae bacterium]
MAIQATPELLRWIDEQLGRGCSPAEMIDAMVTVGHARSFAENLIGQASGRTRVAPASGADEAMIVNEVPEPLPAPLSSGASSIVVDGHHVEIVVNLHHPRIVVFGNLLTSDECDALIAASRPKLARSETVDRASGGTERNEARTSEGAYFFHDASPLLETINRRMALVTRWPLAHGEPLQILHYGVGAEYQPHYDYFSPDDAGTPALLAHGGQRVATLIAYLNTPSAGGATVFPDIGLEVAPIRGNAVFFAYERPDPGSRTLHGGTPVVAGEKWIATRWMREDVYA